MKHMMFKDNYSPSLTEVGGKALSLIKLTSGGFNVPEGAVLTVSFFEEWIAALQNETAFEELWGNPDKFKDLADALKDKAKSFLFSEEQKSILRAIMTEMKSVKLFAVRSSSPEEDLAGASFAGGYETILGVTEERLEDAVKKAFISCMDERVFFYKYQNGFDTTVLRIAVIIQKQINSEVSGVGFSLNPLNNCFDEVVLNANRGLGESVVSGMVTPDEYVMHKQTKELIKASVGSKEEQIVLLKDGGTKTIIQTDVERNKNSLNDIELKKLLELIIKVESYYDFPVDIEWAFADGVLYLLQSRPITTYIPLPKEMQTAPGEPPILFLDGSLVKQGITTPISVMGCDCITGTQAAMFTSMMGSDVTADPKYGLATTRGGRMYINVSSTVKVQGMKKFTTMWDMIDKTTTDMLREMDFDSYSLKKTPDLLKGVVWGTIKNNIGIIKYMGRAKKDPDAYKAWYQPFEDEYDAYLKNLDDETLPLSELMPVLFGKFVDLLDKMLPMTYTAEMSRKAIGAQLEKLFEDGHDKMQYLERSLPDNVTIDMGLALYRLSILDVVKSHSADVLVEMLEDGSIGDEFLSGWNAYMDRFGCRTTNELDVGMSRMYEKPAEVLTQMKQMSETEDAFSPLTIYENSRKLREDTYEEICGQLNGGALKKFQKNYKVLVTLGGKREGLKYWYIRALSAIRERILREADRLVAQNKLESRYDVFWLHYDELIEAPKVSAQSIAQKIEDNKVYYRQVSQIKEFPKFIDSRGKIITQKQLEAGEGEIAGQPISPGVVTGRVKVLHTPDEKPLLPGEIMVTKATDPGWTPLFINASAIILEVGGLLQHGALVAREYGKPCIAGIEGAMNVLEDGQLIEVDASRGIIRLIDEE